MLVASPQRLELEITSASELHLLLTDAEKIIRRSAMESRTAGVLITRHDQHRFSIEVSTAVPFGETREASLF